MAKYRSIMVEFWRDNFIVKLSFEEKSFYQYLMNNPGSSQCGIYSFSLPVAAFETGLSNGRVMELIEKFVADEKILYDEKTEEIMILNWYKYNLNSSRNTHVCINRELKRIKSKSFVSKFYELCKSTKFSLDTMFEDIDIIKEGSNKKLSKEVIESCHREDNIEEKANVASKDNISANNIAEKDNTKEGLKDNEKSGMKEILSAFDNNIHMATFMELESLKAWREEIGSELVVLAINEAAQNNVRNMKYINGILLNWKDNGLKTLVDVKNYMDTFKKGKVKNNFKQSNNNNNNGFRNPSYYEFKPQNVGAYRVVGEDIYEDGTSI
ncbi:DnaD domain protein [Clostridium algidicarnis]|uniref:DnaD domain-containing protein n=2 Tax=Clostridium algidicarnis TaxID=37659 RepID=UPI001CF246FB|nr:DnaD domain protein [Clostridium algidicarnis]MCB2287604.1 DnaD domain protein [Clostridium algidicarnis]